jgi:hypothetical protein
MKTLFLLISIVAINASMDNEKWIKFVETGKHQVAPVVQKKKAGSKHKAGEKQVSKAQKKAITRGARQ